jgi:hypothetical protein
LHYLESGLEVEAELANHVPPSEIKRMERALREALGVQHLARVRVTCPPTGSTI